MEILAIEELLEPLGFTDRRAVRNWCSNNDVLIVKQGKNEFVFEADFKLAYELPFINKLKRKYGNDWEQVYRLYSEGNIPALNELNNCTTTPLSIYKTNSDSKTKILEKLRNYEKKNVA